MLPPEGRRAAPRAHQWQLADSPLGRAAKYPERHDPGLLFPIERAPQRALLGFDGALPFGGVDLWTAYELSWLDAAGKPQVAIATFAVPADSPRLVESKSVKLYLAGLNLTRFATEADVAATLARDLGPRGRRRDRSDADAAARERVAAARRSRRRLHRRVADRGRSLRAAAGGADGGRSRAQRVAVHAALPIRVPGHGTARLRLRADRLSRARGSIARDCCATSCRSAGIPASTSIASSASSPTCGGAASRQALSVYARFTRRGGIDINPYRSSGGGGPPVHVRTARQ